MSGFASRRFFSLGRDEGIHSVPVCSDRTVFFCAIYTSYLEMFSKLVENVGYETLFLRTFIYVCWRVCKVLGPQDVFPPHIRTS